MEQIAKYLQIAKMLQRDILAGKYEHEERFPSEEALVRRFGVSRPTIERALRELKRAGLLQSRAGSGSYLTFAARNATGAIGVIAPDYHKIDFFTDLCDDIAVAARAAGYDTLLGDVSAPDASDRGNWAIAVAEAYALRRTAGVLLEPVDLIPGSHEATKKVLDVLAAKNIPAVLIDRDYLPPPQRSRYDLVGIDNAQAGYRLAKHLIEAGARNIRFLTQPNYASTIRGRIQGVAQAVIDAGLEWRNNHIIETSPSDTAAFRRLMRGKDRPDAFVCRNDPLAATLLQTLAALKLNVPEKVRVAGFDDAKIAKLLNPPLTTIRQPVKRLAETAVASLLQRIRNPNLAPRAILLDAQMVVRQSSAKPAGRQ
ncbi:MAG: GntR family transcriptional regulator [Kiritimatiellae bacterium]|nr:GntR family transcriptional regulator [Kiritimatiellia bacterium]MBQ3341636.1 GntR family transcriptional regulator [Kiritimatiellia bacterium]